MSAEVRSPQEPPVPVRFIVPDTLLAQLREHRERQRAARVGRSQRSSTSPILSIVALASSPPAASDVSTIARQFVDGMNDLQAEIEAAYDAFLLDPGMGPMLYLLADGRILSDQRTWDGEGVEFETSLDQAIIALVVGAKKTGIAGLLTLIPPLLDGTTCPHCSGNRWINDSVCFDCFGRGEVDDRLRERAEQRRAR